MNGIHAQQQIDELKKRVKILEDGVLSSQKKRVMSRDDEVVGKGMQEVEVWLVYTHSTTSDPDKLIAIHFDEHQAKRQWQLSPLMKCYKAIVDKNYVEWLGGLRDE